ncbi:MAG: hypothetical protein ABIH92_05400 [Nanoarchaeota archaeon]
MPSRFPVNRFSSLQGVVSNANPSEIIKLFAEKELAEILKRAEPKDYQTKLKQQGLIILYDVLKRGDTKDKIPVYRFHEN